LENQEIPMIVFAFVTLKFGLKYNSSSFGKKCLKEMNFMLTFLTITFQKKMFTLWILIYHFKIVMGEIPVPVAEIYHPVEGGNGELGFI
jgi:NADH:ubiquinone oxidoreductase subunit D